MGVDFIRKKVSDHRKRYAVMAGLIAPSLFSDTGTAAKQVVKATVEPGEPLQPGERLIVRRGDNGAVVAAKDSLPVARLIKPSKRLERALAARSDCILATVHEVFPESNSVEIKLEG